MKAKTKKPVAKTVKMPDTWKHNFRSATMRANFQLTLTQPMIQMLCSVADDCVWDRSIFSNLHAPDNLFATEGALTKRGLIVRKSQGSGGFVDPDGGFGECWENIRAYCELTPAGRAMADLLKVTGLFVESDAKTMRRGRRPC